MEQKVKTIRWGLMGLGNIAHKFAQDLLKIKDAQLYAVASRTKEKAAEFGSKYGVKQIYGDYEYLVNDPNIDAIYIATPHAMHKENTLLCLEKGIAVLCEKPLAMNSKEVEIMIDKAKEKKVLLMEALWTSFLPHYQYVINELKSKTYGNLLKMEASFGFFREFNDDSRLFKKSLGGGSLLDIGIYPVFAALSAIGKPQSINATATFFENGADSSCKIIFNYKHGLKAYLKSSLLEDLPTEAIFYCEKGTIKINRQFHCPSTITIIVDGKEENINFNYRTIGYNYEVEHFNELLRQRKTESPIMSFKFSQALITLLDEIRAIINLKY